MVLELLEAGLAAVAPATLVPPSLQRLREQGIPLEDCHVLAVGKASVGMTQAVLREVRVASGLVIALEPDDCGLCTVLTGRHPLPAHDAEEIGRQVLEWAQQRGADDTVLCLLSGGGSAMLELPIEGVSMDDIRRTTKLLLKAGAPIDALNAVRSRLSQFKAGGLAQALTPCTLVNILVSDVPGHPPEIVASGPTMTPIATPDPVAVVRNLGLAGALPRSVVDALARPAVLPDPCTVLTDVAATNDTALYAIVEAGAEMGLQLEVHPIVQRGEAREAGRDFYGMAWQRLCEESTLDGIVCGGETTVSVQGSGRGGRNQEWLLGALPVFQGGVLGSLGTDGIDGRSDHAGAILDETVLNVANRAGLDPADHLARSDSARFFSEAQSAILTGPTGTNVADIGLLLR
jgi:hydroxypyruvate reductase